MMSMQRLGLLLAVSFALTASAAEFRPDPRTVQRWGPAYRYPQAGWMVVHIEGAPHARGVQHGRLLAPEIAAYVRCLAACYGPKDPGPAWQQARRLTGATLLGGYPDEQVAEMRGIAEGASAAGARFEGRPLDLTDIAVINSVNELEALDAALEASPAGGEGGPRQTPAEGGAKRPRRTTRCSAFAAVGPATRDGQVVFGHITMWELYPANFYNVWLDVQPAEGFRFAMQTTPGGMHSGMDYAVSESGLLLSETTLDQTPLEPHGRPLAARIREATQYADRIERAAEILTGSGNGLCTAEWILADFRRHEIALLTVGTRRNKLYRSSRREWLADAPGFYWSCNNTKDRELRLETVPGGAARPSAAAALMPSLRDTLWLNLYDRHKGQIDGDFARRALTTPEMVSAYAVDAKYTTADLAAQRKTWAAFGPPTGTTWRPTFAEQRDFPAIKPLVSNPWVVLGAAPPPQAAAAPLPVADLHDPEDDELPAPPKREPAPEPVPRPAWHGTLLPKADADIWLTTAFAHYERLAALERMLREQADEELLPPGELDQLGVELSYYRTLYELAARAGTEVPLARTRASLRDEHWYHVANGKGVLLLHTLRGIVGADKFDRLLDEFGRAHDRREVTVAEFQEHLERGAGRSLQAMFDGWLNRTGLPRLQLDAVAVRRAGPQWITAVTVARDELGAGLVVPVTVEMPRGEVTGAVRLDEPHATVEIAGRGPPLRVIVDKYGTTARGNGGPFTIFSFEAELAQSLIVYGTLDEASANREAAAVLQHALQRREHNRAVPIRADDEVTDEELRTHHLLLIGRPDVNRVAARFRDHLPVAFGPRSFVIRRAAYAHPESAAIVAAENPLHRRLSLVVIAGLSGLATFTAVPHFEHDELSYAEVVVLPHDQEEHDLVGLAPELVRELSGERGAKWGADATSTHPEARTQRGGTP